MKLVFKSGDEQGREVELKPPFISIGREVDNDIVLPNEAISRYHAKIEKDGNIWVIRDLESSNGVRVNGQKINESSPIAHKDEVRISDYKFIVTDETISDEEEQKPVFNIDPNKSSDVNKEKEDKPAVKDTPAQKMIRLGVTAFFTIVILLILAMFLFNEDKKPVQEDEKTQRLARLAEAPLKLFFREERFEKDRQTGQNNVFVYKVSVDNGLLLVTVRNVLDSIDKPQEHLELDQHEIDELKAFLKDDVFVNIQSPLPREKNNRYSRTQLMIMAGNRGNFVEYINNNDEIPECVEKAKVTLKQIIADRLHIPMLTYREAVKRADQLFRLADQKYRDRRVSPVNLYQSVSYAKQSLNVISGYSKVPPFLQKLKKLHETASEDFNRIIDDLKKDAALAERSGLYEKALQYYKEILDRIDDKSHPEYIAANEGRDSMQKRLKRGPRK